jgi:hypothetical protein
MGSAYSCDKPLAQGARPGPTDKVYGNYYAAAIQFNLIGEDPAVLYLLWAKEAGTWKIVAFMVVNP